MTSQNHQYDLNLVVLTEPSIRPKPGSPFLVCCLYRPPSSSIEYFSKIINNIEKVASIINDMVILGDFNINVADYSHPYFSKFQFLCDLFNFNQLVTDFITSRGNMRFYERSCEFREVILRQFPRRRRLYFYSDRVLLNIYRFFLEIVKNFCLFLCMNRIFSLLR